VFSLKNDFSSLSQLNNSLKEELLTNEKKKKEIEERLNEKSYQLQEKLKEMEEKIRKEIISQNDEEKRLLKEKETCYRVHYENELQKVTNSLRNSYTFPSSATSSSSSSSSSTTAVLDDPTTSSLVNHSFHNLSDELSFRKIISSLQLEKQDLLHSIKNHEKSLRYSLQEEYSKKLLTMKKSIEEEGQKKIKELKEMLNEASFHIEKLKNMIKEGKNVISLQNDRNNQMKIQINSLTNENKHLSDLVNNGNSNNSNSKEKEKKLVDRQQNSSFSGTPLSTITARITQSNKPSSSSSTASVSSVKSIRNTPKTIVKPYSSSVSVDEKEGSQLSSTISHDMNGGGFNRFMENQPSSSSASSFVSNSVLSQQPSFLNASNNSQNRMDGSYSGNDDGDSSSFFNQSSTIQSRKSSAISVKSNSSNKPSASSSVATVSFRPPSNPTGSMSTIVSQNGSHSNTNNTHLLTSALEEARITKLTNLQLTEENEEISKKYQELEKKYEELSDLFQTMPVAVPDGCLLVQVRSIHSCLPFMILSFPVSSY
jgi:predicted phage-related endonuclease